MCEVKISDIIPLVKNTHNYTENSSHNVQRGTLGLVQPYEISRNFKKFRLFCLRNALIYEVSDGLSQKRLQNRYIM